jgi:hypothetical protein
MAVEDDDKEEGEVDLRVELINALEELRKEINKELINFVFTLMAKSLKS